MPGVLMLQQPLQAVEMRDSGKRNELIYLTHTAIQKV